MITEIPRQFQHECDRCDRKVMDNTKEPFPDWGKVLISTKDREHTFYICDSCIDDFDDYIAGRRIE